MSAARHYLGDGVYVRETPEGMLLEGNASGGQNVIYLDSRTYNALRAFAISNSYESLADDATRSAIADLQAQVRELRIELAAYEEQRHELEERGLEL